MLIDAGLTTLRNEVDNDSTGQGYKTGSTWKASGIIEDIINKKITGPDTITKNVSIEEAIVYLIDEVKYDGLKNMASRTAGLIVDELKASKFSDVNLANTACGFILDNLVSENVITATNKTNLIAKSTISVVHKSRAEEILNNRAYITFNDIERAKVA